MLQPGAYEMEPTYYNTREELGLAGGSGVPVCDLSKYIKDMEADKLRFKEEFLVWNFNLVYSLVTFNWSPNLYAL